MKKQLLLLVIMLMPLVAKAYDAYIGGIYYNFNNEAKTATVTYSSQNNAYSGVVEIPSTVDYNGETYIVTEIGGFAFGYCGNVTSISIPSTVTTIGSYAFSVCTSLYSITIPNSVTSIGEFAFSSTGWLDNQPDGILYLDNWLIGYKGEKPIGGLTIADGTRGIAAFAFQGCSGLTSVTIPNSVTGIGDRAFEGCSDLPTVTIPNNVTSIGIGAFRDCSDLTSVTIGNSVTNIGELAFHIVSKRALVTMNI